MYLKGIKKALTVKNLKRFLQYDRTNLIIFAVIIIVHFVLSLGLAVFGVSYTMFISILYAIFNFPILLSTVSLSGFNIYTMNTAAVIIPLIVNVIYWYIIACIIRAPIEARGETKQFRYGFYVISMFLVFAIFACIWFSLTIGTYYPLI